MAPGIGPAMGLWQWQAGPARSLGHPAQVLPVSMLGRGLAHPCRVMVATITTIGLLYSVGAVRIPGPQGDARIMPLPVPGALACPGRAQMGGH